MNAVTSRAIVRRFIDQIGKEGMPGDDPAVDEFRNLFGRYLETHPEGARWLEAARAKLTSTARVAGGLP